MVARGAAVVLYLALAVEGSTTSGSVDVWKAQRPRPRQLSTSDPDGTGVDGNALAAHEEGRGAWSLSAFRAFHEMRAGPAPNPVGGSSDADAEGEDSGQWGGWSLPRSIGGVFNTVRGRKREDDAEGGNRVDEGLCWHMKGRLTNAATGRTVALVEGVEIVRSLKLEAGPHDGLASEAHGGKRTEGFGLPALDKILAPGLWRACGIHASKKFFVYQDPETGEPMSTFRHTPVDRWRPVHAFEQFAQVISHVLEGNGRMLVVSEWSGRSVKAETVNNNCVQEVGGIGGASDGSTGGPGGGLPALLRGMLARSPPSPSPQRVFNIQFFVEARTPKEERERERRRSKSRPGSHLVAFGSTPLSVPSCKESYSYVTGKRGGRDRGGGKGSKGGGGGGGAFMTYARYGECPAWYGAGRMCSLDIQGREIGSFRALPEGLKQMVLREDPGFEDAHPRTLEECRKGIEEETEARERARRARRHRRHRPWLSLCRGSSKGGGGGG